MARIQQAIDINVPPQAVYGQLMKFEEYPRFMQDVEQVRQLDDTHLHWEARLADRRLAWDAEITERQDGRCIAWRNLDGPANAGRLEVEPMGQQGARVVMTMDCEPGQLVAGSEGDPGAALAQRLEHDLARFKQLLEGQGAESAPQAAQPVTSAPSLSQSSDDDAEDGRFSVAEEQNFDQQSDAARRVGQITDGADAMASALREQGPEAGGKLKDSIERAVPRGD